MKNDNIIRFYILANKLKNIIRRGWIEIGIDKERLESDAEHIYGTLMLAIAINSEYELDLDMYKVLKILALHETEEILMPDYTVRSNITKLEKNEQGRVAVSKVVSGLASKNVIDELLLFLYYNYIIANLNSFLNLLLLTGHLYIYNI